METGASGGVVSGVGGGARTTRFMMEGVGARVIRGPEWKWGKQVFIFIKKLHNNHYLIIN